MRTIKKSLYILWLVFILLIVAALYSVILTVAARAMGPQAENELVWGTLTPLECGIEREVPMSTLKHNFYLPNGIEVFAFDTNGDGMIDVEVGLPQNDLNRYPLAYFFDRDHDGDMDIKWDDSKRDGTCGENITATWIGDNVTGEPGKEL